MDPVTIIVQAMIMAIANLADPLVKDSYASLKELIKRKFQEPTLTKAVDKLEQNPTAWEGALMDCLYENNAGQDAEVIASAQQLFQMLKQQESRSDGDTFIGDHNQKNVHSGSGDIVTGRKIDTGGGSYTETNIDTINTENFNIK